MKTTDITIIKEKLSYDPITGILTHKLSGRHGAPGTIAGYISKQSGYVCIGINGCEHLAHRLAFAISYGRWPTNEVDHINRVRTDNRLVNLREATRTANSRNLTKRSSTTTNTIGVSRAKNGKYRAYISISPGNRVHLGYFSTEEEAAAKRKSAEVIYFKEFAPL